MQPLQLPPQALSLPLNRLLNRLLQRQRKQLIRLRSQMSWAMS